MVTEVAAAFAVDTHIRYGARALESVGLAPLDGSRRRRHGKGTRRLARHRTPGNDRSSFTRGMRVQVHAVQAMCRHVWGQDIDITGRWDGPTRDATAAVLDRIEVGGRLTEDERWHAFRTATARRG